MTSPGDQWNQQSRRGKVSRLTTSVDWQLTLPIDHRERLVQWLSKSHVSLARNGALTITESGIGYWLILSPNFGEWKRNPQTVWWLHGIRKCRCLSLFALDINSILIRRTAGSGKAILWWALPYHPAIRKGKDPSIRCPELVWCHALADTLPDHLEMIEVPIPLIRRQQKTFILIDAIDEAPGLQDMLRVLEMILAKRLESLHLLVSSQLQRDIEECLEPIATASISVGGRRADDDISLYVQQRMQEDPNMRKWEEYLKREVDSPLFRGANGR